MTKKRHTKLMRALATRIHERSTSPIPDMYKCVRLANDGLIPKTELAETRDEWWKSIGLVLSCYGMENIKEANR